MQILGLIPARGGSKGVPRKNIRLVAGKPLLEYTAEAALAAGTLSRVILSTERWMSPPTNARSLRRKIRSSAIRGRMTTCSHSTQRRLHGRVDGEDRRFDGQSVA
jgi:CMP-2-keto-3-deoxyoctulosonic acid synthetase